MTESKVIKINEENYRWLARLAAELQKEKERPVSLDEALTTFKMKKTSKSKLSDLAGSWKMSDKEADEIKKAIKKGWSSWKIPSV